MAGATPEPLSLTSMDSTPQSFSRTSTCACGWVKGFIGVRFCFGFVIDAACQHNSATPLPSIYLRGPRVQGVLYQLFHRRGEVHNHLHWTMEMTKRESVCVSSDWGRMHSMYLARADARHRGPVDRFDCPGGREGGRVLIIIVAIPLLLLLLVGGGGAGVCHGCVSRPLASGSVTYSCCCRLLETDR